MKDQIQFFIILFLFFFASSISAQIEAEIKANGNAVFSEIAIGTAFPNHPVHIVQDAATANPISIEAGTPPSARDVLEIKVDAATPDNAQFLELERGASVVARINTDGSAEFASIEYPDGTVQNSAALAPVAYGYYRNGTGITSGSGNFTISYVSGSEYYLIDIPGVSYFFSSYTTLLTASSSNIKTIQESSLGGDLIVICEDSAGNRVQGSFQFIVYE